MPLPPGTRLGPFEVVSLLGAGGMGEVYRGRDEGLGRDVALKVLPAGLSADRERLIRFAHEARAASNLNHPNIVTIYQIGQANGMPFIAMELVEGMSLRDVMNAGPLALKKLLAYATQLAEGVARAHEAGIVHRDLKPENVMVTRDGFVKVLDFGLAKLFQPEGGEGARAGASQDLTQAGLVVGSPGYMSPEQASGRPLDHRSDQFSLGVIVYEMATGRRAFQRETPVQTLTAIIQDEPEPIQRLNPKVPAPVRWVVDRCLAKDPEERYASTKDLVRELRQLQRNVETLAAMESSGLSTSTRAVPPPPQATVRTAPPELGPVAEPGRTAAVPAGTSPKAAPPAPRPSLAARAGKVVLAAAGALAVIGGAAAGGYWLRERLFPEAPRWKGDLVLGGSARILAPRVSPDGKRVAFVTPVGGTTQVGVLDPASGDWTVLTKRTDAGSVDKVDWSADSSRILFDRVTDVPRGVFAVPAIGGEERLVLEDAEGPEVLPDGRLLVARLDRDRSFRLQAFRPDVNQLQPVGPPIVAESTRVVVRVFPDGREALLWGRVATKGASPERQALVVDLASGAVRPFSRIPIVPPLCPAPDGTEVLGVVRQGDLFQVVAVSRDGQSVHPLLGFTVQPWSISVAPDGAVYVLLRESPAELLRISPGSPVPERLASTSASLAMAPVELPDGRVVVPALASGRRLLLSAGTAGDVRSLLDTRESAMPPVTPVGSDRIAFVLGGVAAPPKVAVASVADGRILDRFPLPGSTAPKALAASPDGGTLALADAGAVWTVDLASRKLERRCAGDGVAFDPRTGDLVVQRNEPDGVHLVLRSRADPSEREVLYQRTERIAPTPLSGRAVGEDGRILVVLATGGGGAWTPGILDPATASVAPVPVRFEGDVVAVAWGSNGSILAMGVGQRGELWRFRRVP